MTELLTTEKYRIDRRFFDSATGKVYRSIAEIPGRRELDERALPIFFRIGYVPGNATLFRGVECLPGGCTIELGPERWSVKERFRFAKAAAGALANESHLEEEGVRLLRAAAARADQGARQAVVPLSGGLDSRAILGMLLERTEARNIATYTYGLPGTLDYEIGNRLATWAGTRHVRMDLRHFTFSAARVSRTALLSDANTEVVKPSIWTQVLDIFGPDAEYWSGFTGDGIGGSHYLPDQGGVDAAVQAFVEGDTRSLQFYPIETWRSQDAWPVARETKYDDVLSRHEAVWFENHVERYTAHHIFMRGARYQVPFMDDEFASFMLAAPPELRRGKRLFNRVVVRAFPRLYRFPSKGYGFGLSGGRLRQLAFKGDSALRKALWRVAPGKVRHPGTSYIDFAYAVRERSDVRSLVQEAVRALASRGVLDRAKLERLLDDHLRGRRDTSALLTLLTSLELSLRAYCDVEASASLRLPLSA